MPPPPIPPLPARPARAALPAAPRPAAAAVAVAQADTAGNVTVDEEPSLSPCTTTGRESTQGPSQVKIY